MEKYDVSTTGTGGGGGEYPLQDGFGWTNGVTLKMLDLICPKEQPCDNVPATRPLSESTTQPVKQNEAEPNALTLLYIEQCHYVHKIGIALSLTTKIPNTTLSTVYAFIFLLSEKILILFYQLVNHYTSIFIFPHSPFSPDNFLVEQSVI